MKRTLLILMISFGLTAMSSLSGFGSSTNGDKVKLGQNYPNPAVGTTYIEVTFEGDATLTIYNLVGKVIEVIPVTSSTISIDVSGYTEGIYLYTLESNGEKVTKRMTVKKH
jgi:hypothetical protein